MAGVKAGCVHLCRVAGTLFDPIVWWAFCSCGYAVSSFANSWFSSNWYVHALLFPSPEAKMLTSQTLCSCAIEYFPLTAIHYLFILLMSDDVRKWLLKQECLQPLVKGCNRRWWLDNEQAMSHIKTVYFKIIPLRNGTKRLSSSSSSFICRNVK